MYSVITMERAFFAILLADGLVWVRSGLEKLMDPEFVESLAGTLTKFASKNPYPWYTNFLKNVAIPNAMTYAYLTQWGEILSGVSIVGAALYLLTHQGNKENQGDRLAEFLLLCGLVGGAFLNLNFWLAAGWMSPSTDTLNILMMAIEIIGIVTFAIRIKEYSLY